MSESVDKVLEGIKAKAATQAIRVTLHAQDEMDAGGVTLDEILAAIAVGQIVENYPEHRRGSCCLLYGHSPKGHPLHIVCTTAYPLLIIITVYIPKPPKWLSPTQRRQI
jgi:Domain of unknown function (DUF4258)